MERSMGISEAGPTAFVYTAAARVTKGHRLLYITGLPQTRLTKG